MVLPAHMYMMRVFSVQCVVFRSVWLWLTHEQQQCVQRFSFSVHYSPTLRSESTLPIMFCLIFFSLFLSPLNHLTFSCLNVASFIPFSLRFLLPSLHCDPNTRLCFCLFIHSFIHNLHTHLPM